MKKGIGNRREIKNKEDEYSQRVDFLRLQQLNLCLISIIGENRELILCSLFDVSFLKEGVRHTCGLQVDSKCSYSTELSRVAEKGKIK